MLLEKNRAANIPDQGILIFLAACSLALMLAAGSAIFAACSFGEQAEAVFSGELSLPEYTGAAMVSERQAVFSFSMPVSATSVFVASSGSGFTAEADGGADELSSEVRVNLSSPPSAGEKFVLAMTVMTAQGNTLSLSETLAGYNSRVPRMRISEARIVYNKPKSEFIELEILSGGNLSGAIIETYGYKSSKEKNTAYTFPPAEVNAGDYVVLHYRLLPEGADFTDETGADLAISTGDGACDKARDLWLDAGGKPFSDACVFLLRERSGGALMDALVYSKDGASHLSGMQSAAKEAISAGVWEGAGAFPAFDATGATATRTICREPGAERASPETWYICATSNATPGEANSEKRYSPN